MTWPLTLEEVREARRRGKRCTDCGRQLPRYSETQDGLAHRCFACLWRWQHGTWPAGWRNAA